MRKLRTSVFLIYALSAAGNAQSPSASILLQADKVVRVVDRALFGANIEWIWNGNSIYDPGSGANRPEIVTRARTLSPGLLRFPGGVFADYYRWRDGIGPRSSRPVRPHLRDGDSSVSSFGTHEFLGLCRDLGASPLLQVNVITGTSTEAAQWVSYVNHPTHPERAANGAPAPFQVRYWELGNEQYMSAAGSSTPESFLTVEEYAARFSAFSKAMKAADPSIRTGAVSSRGFGSYQFESDPDWNRKLLQRAGSEIDFLAFHQGYAPIIFDPSGVRFQDAYMAMFAFPRLLESNLIEIEKDILQYAPSKASTMTLAMTEWGPLFHYDPASPWVDHAKTHGSAVFTASMLRTFLLAPRLQIAAFFKFVEPSFLGMMFWDGVPKPSFYAMQMFSKHFGQRVIAADVSSPVYTSPPVGIVNSVAGVPYLEAVASLSADGSEMYVVVINKHLTASMTTRLEFVDFTPAASAVQRTLAADSLDANNGPDLLQFPGVYWAPQIRAPYQSMWDHGAPDVVSPKTASLTASTVMSVKFPPISVTALEFARR